jgi:hypothetical protein
MMNPTGLLASEVLRGVFEGDLSLRALAEQHDRLSTARREVSDVQAFIEDYGHYLPMMQRRRVSRMLAEHYETLMTMRRNVIEALDASLGDL